MIMENNPATGTGPSRTGKQAKTKGRRQSYVIDTGRTVLRGGDKSSQNRFIKHADMTSSITLEGSIGRPLQDAHTTRSPPPAPPRHSRHVPMQPGRPHCLITRRSNAGGGAAARGRVPLPRHDRCPHARLRASHSRRAGAVRWNRARSTAAAHNHTPLTPARGRRAPNAATAPARCRGQSRQRGAAGVVVNGAPSHTAAVPAAHGRGV